MSPYDIITYCFGELLPGETFYFIYVELFHLALRRAGGVVTRPCLSKKEWKGARRSPWYFGVEGVSKDSSTPLPPTQQGPVPGVHKDLSVAAEGSPRTPPPPTRESPQGHPYCRGGRIQDSSAEPRRGTSASGRHGLGPAANSKTLRRSAGDCRQRPPRPTSPRAPARHRSGEAT